MTFGAGERILSDWMNENAFVCWLEHPAPWEIEHQLILELRPPLNLAENRCRIRSTQSYPSFAWQAKARARSLDVLPNGFSLGESTITQARHNGMSGTRTTGQRCHGRVHARLCSRRTDRKSDEANRNIVVRLVVCYVCRSMASFALLSQATSSPAHPSDSCP